MKKYTMSKKTEVYYSNTPKGFEVYLLKNGNSKELGMFKTRIQAVAFAKKIASIKGVNYIGSLPF